MEGEGREEEGKWALGWAWVARGGWACGGWVAWELGQGGAGQLEAKSTVAHAWRENACADACMASHVTPLPATHQQRDGVGVEGAVLAVVDVLVLGPELHQPHQRPKAPVVLQGRKVGRGQEAWGRQHQALN